jgi:carbonic anhydrase
LSADQDSTILQQLLFQIAKRRKPMLRRNVLGAFLALMLVLGRGIAIAADHAPHWSYQGAGGPTHWGALEPEFGQCGMGHAQSPIDIRHDMAQKADLPDIRFAYKPAPLKLIDNGHTIQVNYPPGSFIDVGGHRYELVQFHFHKPSEESIDGKRHAMVAHLVHKDAEGRLAVVAVLLNAGDINPMVATLWNNLPPRKEAEAEPNGVEIDASDLLPSDRTYYTFAGSLTTPPCSEGVTWFVLRTPSTLSDGEITRFGQMYPMNARPLQPLNGRSVRVSR